ncbi:MAG: hypothetical protein U1F57_08160 [bacterium]
MSKEPRLTHLLMVPLITALVCNPFANSLFGLFSWEADLYLIHMAAAITFLYGIYLKLFRSPPKTSWKVLWIASGAAIGLSYLPSGGLFTLAGFGLAFSGMRVFLLGEPLKVLPKDLLAFGAGVVVASLFTPVGLIASVAAFLLTQLIYEMRGGEAQTFTRDRFDESRHTAEKILKNIS